MAVGLLAKKPVTDVFTHDTDIDRRQCHRTVPMRVLCLGMGRTGTASLRQALKELGFNDCYHMMSASVENPADCRLWSRAFAAKYAKQGSFGRAEWDQLLGHCQAVCDWPAIAFSDELIAAYPEAKVIFTSRDVDSWYRSVLETVDWRANDPELRLLSYFDYASSLYYPMLRSEWFSSHTETEEEHVELMTLTSSEFWDVFFGGDFAANGKRRYAEHYQHVRSCVNDVDNFLDYRINEGWEPLCHFLGVDVPKTPFPRTNDSSGFVSRCKARNRSQMYNVALHLIVAILSVLVVCWLGNVLPRRSGLAVPSLGSVGMHS